MPDAPSAPTARVLFIGNSYTAANDLPTIFEKLSESDQSPLRFEVAHHTPGGQTWEGHDADSTVEEMINLGWDYVVLQDQSAQAWTVGVIVKDALISLDRKIKATGAQTVLFMTWARSAEVADGYRFYQDLHLHGYYYRNATAVDARVAPVGRAWELALRDPETILHADDGSHPNAHGTYLAACVFYATLTGQSPVGLGDGGLGISEQAAGRLQQVAWRTVVSRQRPAPPLIGEWPLSGAQSGNDLVPSDTLSFGDTVGPGDTPTSATQFAEGKFAAIPYFDGINPANITVSFYAYRSDWSTSITEQPQTLVAKMQGYQIQHYETTLYASVYTDEVAPTPIAYPVDGLGAGWHHFALTYDGTTYALWIDGTQVGSATTSGPLRYYFSGTPIESQLFTPIAIGGWPMKNALGVNDHYNFTGKLASLRIYDTALTAAEISDSRRRHRRCHHRSGR